MNRYHTWHDEICPYRNIDHPQIIFSFFTSQVSDLVTF
ncbi:hypothetical protein A1D15_2701 [Lactiplantibacillus plantarum]|uniref:Uncharacterized protein n=1 Tax=Lactiplantibacillus plantarum WJL TaxID=1350466 RepID=A0A837P6X0_LACPN|nr:hypothetical protein JM48_2803 [Lactiplantibacillus plantarum]KPN42977.1 hypothetical protein WJL_2014 [Lactiplantibacillus plantarum WJL]KPN86933.1 hypothetical protein Nizo2877_0791 [Lactiplantibacillus plantarum]KZE01301.1 hypothetical protein FBR4_0294 [Lactiplantibacillus plantarum]KZU39047.1 hypothetical protein Nizo2753_2112 [Lactiplantibacillus plantarum]